MRKQQIGTLLQIMFTCVCGRISISGGLPQGVRPGPVAAYTLVRYCAQIALPLYVMPAACALPICKFKTRAPTVKRMFVPMHGSFLHVHFTIFARRLRNGAGQVCQQTSGGQKPANRKGQTQPAKPHGQRSMDETCLGNRPSTPCAD